jgi:ABC-type multidrug transport system fused ATPase/permease subunit
MEIEEGTILLDGIDVSRVNLNLLRGKITMIPQDPTLFAGPLRYSLDPAGGYPDTKLWDTLGTWWPCIFFWFLIHMLLKALSLSCFSTLFF